MRVIRDKDEMRQWSREQRAAGVTMAFVPTMGYLHDGHLALVGVAKQKAKAVVVSIYVNPTQFSADEDFHSYPRDAARDHGLLEAATVDVAFEPAALYTAPPQQPPLQHTSSPQSTATASNAGMVVGATAFTPGQYDVYVHPEHLQRPLCGAARPHFFRGVATVVTKLFHIVEPDVAVFGRKDFQQLCVIRALVRDLDFCIDVVGVEIEREWDGLATSSRNVRLTAAARDAAPCMYAALKAAQVVWGQVADAAGVASMLSGVKTLICEGGGEVVYVEAVDRVSLEPVGGRVEEAAVLAVAAFFPAVGGGSVRLIDNIELDARERQKC